MSTNFAHIGENLHHRVTRALAIRVLEAERAGETLNFPNEAELCGQLGVSRTIVREAVKVLADKGMLAVRPRSGTSSKPRSEWNLLDPDILGWQAELQPDGRILRDLCEVRLAIEPVAAGFAALRASPKEVATIGRCLEALESKAFDAGSGIEPALQFHAAVVAACHNPLLQQLSAAIRHPFRTALAYAARLRASGELGLAAHRSLFEAISRRDPLKARAAADEIVGLAMLMVEEVLRYEASRRRKAGRTPGATAAAKVMKP